MPFCANPQVETGSNACDASDVLATKPHSNSGSIGEYKGSSSMMEPSSQTKQATSIFRPTRVTVVMRKLFCIVILVTYIVDAFSGPDADYLSKYFEALRPRQVNIFDSGFEQAANYSCSNNSDCGWPLRGFCGSNSRCECQMRFGGKQCHYCKENHYAAECGVLCNEVANCSGHGRCSWQDGSCLCFPGWSGSKCNRNVSTIDLHTSPLCAAPPREICCTHLWSNTSESLRVTFRTPAALSSVTLWNPQPDGPALLQDERQLAGMDIALRISDTVTGCSISTAIELPAGSAGPLPGPYSLRRLTCGVRATSAILSLPRLAAAAPSRPPAVAARICVTTGPAVPAASPIPAALWIQTAAGGSGEPAGQPEPA